MAVRASRMDAVLSTAEGSEMLAPVPHDRQEPRYRPADGPEGLVLTFLPTDELQELRTAAGRSGVHHANLARDLLRDGLRRLREPRETSA